MTALRLPTSTGTSRAPASARSSQASPGRPVSRSGRAYQALSAATPRLARRRSQLVASAATSCSPAPTTAGSGPVGPPR